jgi:parallel beta-helix repeat protein
MPGRGDFTSIVGAVARAPGGARIVVHPGHYRESVRLDKPLEIIGTGNVEDIVIESGEDEPIVFDTNIGLVRNLTLRQVKKFDPSASNKMSAVWIKQGRLELEDCDITSSDGPCILVSKSSDPRIRRNRIHDSQQSGVLIGGTARGTYEDNEIFANSFGGITATGHASPICRRNRVYGNRRSGLTLLLNSVGIFEDNEFFENAHAGVKVADDANPIVRRNKIYGNVQSGIRFVERAAGTLEDNDISKNGRAGIKVEDTSKPAVRRNKVNYNSYEAIWVLAGARGVFSDNDLTNNKRGAWDIDAETAKNVIRERNIENG